MKQYIFFLLVVLVILLLSCRAEKSMDDLYDIHKAYSEQILKKIAKDNCNAIGIMTSHANFSYLVSYTESGIDIHFVNVTNTNGKQHIVKKNAQINLISENTFCFDSIQTAKKEIRSRFPIQLDGDYLIIHYKQNGILRKEHIAVQITDLRYGSFNSLLLKQIAGDIQKYDVWDYHGFK